MNGFANCDLRLTARLNIRSRFLAHSLRRLLPSPRSDSTRLTRQSVTDLLWRRLVPVLPRAAQRKDSVGSYSKAALKQLESEVAAEQGAQK